MSPVIEFERVTKAYRLGTGQQSLREAVSAVPRRLLGRGNGGTESGRVIQAVNDVSFTVEPGTTLGIIGRNGAGKTTILKLLSGVTRPTTGRIHTSGRLSALIELGAGFHPDLTGRENVFLNGAILGLSKREIDRKYDAIVAFAELEPFMDTPVKRYSSGMYARLGFAVAAHSQPDLLLVDEVLAVGDLGFQRKCHNFMHQFVAEGNTAIFVSHYMYVIEQLCTHVLWIDQGRPKLLGSPSDILPAYFDSLDQMALDRINTDQQQSDYDQTGFRVTDVLLHDAEGNVRDTFVTGSDIIVELKYESDSELVFPHFVIGVNSGSSSQPLFLASMLVDGQAPRRLSKKGTVQCRFDAVPLMPKTYELWTEVLGSDRAKLLMKWRRVGGFLVKDEEGTSLNVGKGGVRHMRSDSTVRVKYQWVIPEQ